MLQRRTIVTTVRSMSTTSKRSPGGSLTKVVRKSSRVRERRADRYSILCHQIGHHLLLLSNAHHQDAIKFDFKKNAHWAGRQPLGRPAPTTLSINGVYHMRHVLADAATPGAMTSERMLYARPLGPEGDRPSNRGTPESQLVPEHTMVVGAACSVVFTGKPESDIQPLSARLRHRHLFHSVTARQEPAQGTCARL